MFFLVFSIFLIGCSESKVAPAESDTHTIEIYKPNPENRTELVKVARLENLSSSSTIYLTAGLVNYEHGALNKAIEVFDKVIAEDPKNEVALYYRALAKYNLSRFDEAIKDADELVKMQPENPAVYGLRSSFKIGKKDLQGALKDYDKSIQLSPKNISLYFSRADLKVMLQDTNGAIEDMNRVLEINPNSAKAYIYRADFKFSKNDFKGSEADYTKAIEVEPINELAYAYRGILKLTIYKDSVGALKDFDKSIQIKPNEVAHTFRAQISMSKNDYDNGIKDLDSAIKINPNYVNARVLRGAIRFGILHKLEGALEDHSKAIELQPNNALYYTYRGDVRAELGDEGNSQADYSKAEALDPNVWSLRQT